MKIMWKKRKNTVAFYFLLSIWLIRYILKYIYYFIYSVLFINKANHSARQHGQSAVVPCRQL